MGYAWIVQDRARRRNILIGLLLMATGIVGALLTTPRSNPQQVEKREPSPDKPPTALPTPPPLDKAELDATIKTLDQWLTSAAANSNDLAVLLHAVRGLGPDHDLKGKTTKQALLERLPSALMLQDGKPRVSPLQADLPDLAVLAVLLEADVPLEQPLLDKVSVGSWLQQTQKEAVAVRRSNEWYSRNWLIDVLTVAAGRGIEAASSEQPRERLHDFAVAGFSELSRTHTVFGKWAGQGPQVALQSRDSVEQLRQQQLGPYGLDGWGLSLAHSVLRAVVTLNQARGAADASLDQSARQLLGQLVMRQLFERQLWAPGKDPLPTSGPIDQLGYCGRLLEALAWARLAIDDPMDHGARQQNELGPTLRDCATSISGAIAPLQLTATATPEPPGSPLPQLGERTDLQRRSEAVSQALRGLRMARRAYWPSQPKSAPSQ